MSAEIQTKHVSDLNLLIVNVSGDYTVSDDTELLEPCLNEFVEKKCTRCLFDFRNASFSAQTLPMLERSEVYEAHNIPRTTKIAGVFNEITNDAEFGETALHNRGWNIKLFTSPDQAAYWLKA